MATRHILTEYLEQAIQRTRLVHNDQGFVVAYIPEFPGTLAYGHSAVDAVTQLVERLDGWVQNALVQGYDLPILGDIDFSDAHSRQLTQYDVRVSSEAVAPHIFENEAELEAAFLEFDA